MGIYIDRPFIPSSLYYNKKSERPESTHLGKNVGKYSTPDKIDSSLLVPIPRIENREKYGITGDEFVGVDVWNGYEFSTLTEKGRPVNYILKIVYPANSNNVVESKSLKLYLNSFNMSRELNGDRELLIERIQEDLSRVIHKDVLVQFRMAMPCSYQDYEPSKDGIEMVYNAKNWSIIDNATNSGDPFARPDDNIEFTDYTENPSLLEGEWIPTKKVFNSKQTISGPNYHLQKFKSAALRSNCKVTNQPDWGDVYVAINSPYHITSVGLLKYIVSLRNENHFHEEICELIYKRLYDRFEPKDLLVTCLYTRRGGIDINPVRASDSNFLLDHVSSLVDIKVPFIKSERQ